MFKQLLCSSVICLLCWQINSESILLKSLNPQTLDTNLLTSPGQGAKRIVRSVPNNEPAWSDSLTETEYELLRKEAGGRTGVIGSKIDLITLIIALVGNGVQAIFNLFSGNYLTIVYNLAAILEAVILFFYGN